MNSTSGRFPKELLIKWRIDLQVNKHKGSIGIDLQMVSHVVGFHSIEKG